jgi:hypothetical protein
MKTLSMLGAALALVLTGCLRQNAAIPIHPAATTDTPNVWIYLSTNDRDADGVYRCYDVEGKQPVCKKAKIILRE